MDAEILHARMTRPSTSSNTSSSAGNPAISVANPNADYDSFSVERLTGKLRAVMAILRLHACKQRIIELESS